MPERAISTTGRIVDALEKLEKERDRDSEPRTILISTDISGQPKGDPSRWETRSRDRTTRYWCRDDAHVEPASQSGSLASATKFTKKAPSPGGFSAVEFRGQHHELAAWLCEVVDALILGVAWQGEGAGWISLHIMDESLDPGLLVAVATGVANRTDERVLLLDADIDRGILSHKVGLNATVGLGNLLARGNLPHEALFTSGNLSYVPAGPRPPSLPAWLECHRLFTDCRQRFPLTLVYCPLATGSLLPRLLRACDEAWLWCANGHTPQSTIRHSLDLIRQSSSHLAGFVLVETS